MERVKIGGILQGKGLAGVEVLGIPDRPGVASLIFRTLGRHRINVEFIVHVRDESRRSHVIFCVDRKDMLESISLLDEHQAEIGHSHILHNH